MAGTNRITGQSCGYRYRAAPSQWETPLLCNDVSHWLGASLESALQKQCGSITRWSIFSNILTNETTWANQDSFDWTKFVSNYCKTSNIRCTLVGIEIVAHSDVVGASPAGAAPTTSSFSIYHLASIYSIKTTARRDEKHLSFGISCVSY